MSGARRLDAVLAGTMRRERQRRKWRQADLAERLGWPLSRVTRIENSSQPVHVEDLLSLCRVLGMSAADLLHQADPADLQTLGLGLDANVGHGQDNDDKTTPRE